MKPLRLASRQIVTSLADTASVADGELVVRDGLVSDGADLTGRSNGVININLRDDVVLPGLINCHDHLHLNCAPELRPERRFRNAEQWIAWVEDRMRPGIDKHIQAPGLAAPLSARLWQGALKNVLAGTTTVTHHDPHHEILDHPSLPIRIAPCGWAHSPGLAGKYGPSLEQSWEESPPDRPWVVHLAEGVDVGAGAEIDALARAGCLGSRTVAVHAVGLDERAKLRLLDHGGSAIWCPSSNLTMLGATLDPRSWDELDEGGIGRLGIGTDSRLTGSRDLLDELRVAAETGDLEPIEVAKLATANAARVLRLDHAGRLEHGSPADLFVIRAGQDPWKTLLEARRSDLRAVALGGRPVITDPDLGSWFHAYGIKPMNVRLDGRPKLMDPASLGPPGATDLEPGLEVLR